MLEINKIHQMDALLGLKKLSDESVNCVVTSPPYWGLRDYGVAGQIGLERTPEAYVAKLVEVFRQVRRVLRRHGTVWLNLGDTFYSGKGACNNPGGGNGSLGKHLKQAGAHPVGRAGPNRMLRPAEAVEMGLKPKDTCGIPWAVALALRADGWYLRSDIIWAKPNPMPEPVRDRPTKAHEYVFLLTKMPRYFYDADAVRLPITSSGGACFGKQNHDTAGTGAQSRKLSDPSERNHPGGANLRSVWTIPTQPYREAHFATFPEKLVERCIRAGTSEKGCCPKCEMPWVRVVKKIRTSDGREKLGARYGAGYAVSLLDHRGKAPSGLLVASQTLSWRPTCQCEPGVPIPCTVLDPFMGSGTTAVVAKRLGRNFIGFELNAKYVKLAKTRLKSLVQNKQKEVMARSCSAGRCRPKAGEVQKRW